MKQTNSLYRKTSRRILNFFLKGLLLIAPIAITIFVIYKLFEFFDNLLPFSIPGLGILIIFTSITIVGFLGNFLIKTPISHFVDKIFEQVPLVKILYSSITDLLSAFVGQKKKFTQPVMVILSKENDIRKLGFITEHDLQSIGIPEEYVAVYLPHSYNFSGNMFIVPARNVIPVNAPSAEFMKFIVSGGVTKV